MRQYVFKRLLLMVPTLLLVTVIVFSVMRYIPGDVVVLMFEEKAYAKDLEALRAKLGLDRPVYLQYATWIGHVVQGDLGESLWTKRPVLEEIVRRLPISVELGLMAISVALCLALPIGILAAIRQDTVWDYITRSGAIVGLSVPSFWKATLVIVLPSIWFGWAPPLQFTPLAQNLWQHFSQFILPAIILGIGPAAGIMRLTRALMLEVLRQDYIRTAWSKGLHERRVVIKHALKNAIIPVVTVVGIQIYQIASGTVIMETIFGLPGMGRFLVDALFQRDYPAVQGVILLSASIIVCMNLLVDMTYAYLDPRIRYQ
ncbi:MAG TPA: ABC transporter permease [Candidatus Tectomicrobia bacterium]|jgi:peptide/nickel transport system permease protein